ncbi:MAG: TlpA family protein disulfide reductase [Acidobacteriia bacterium]|nr:TlpA family protein disulfide reductase [Terriglobia bacterium]
MSSRTSFALFLAFAPAALAQSITGLWDATVKINDLTIPFRMEFALDGPCTQSGIAGACGVTGTFFNGEERFTSTSGGLVNNTDLDVKWDHYLSELKATLKDGVITGSYTHGGRRGGTYPFEAHRHTAEAKADANAPSIGGLWELQNVKSGKGESTWRFIVQQTGGDVSATVLRVDGDTGALTGTYRGGKFLLSHFDGARSALMEVTPAADGTLAILMDGKTKMTAVRSEEARAKNLPPPDDFNKHTGVKDANEPFRFSFPDLNGKIVSNTDPRFRGKVVLVEITGSWCPNCHDEAPFLVDLYKKYHEQGLEIVALSFEEESQLANPTRLRAFIKKYGIEYNVLLCGQPDDAKQKLTQAVNWDSWPTSFFIDRQGLVRLVHAGFPGSPSGELYRQATKQFKTEIEGLLAENVSGSR